MYEQIKNAVRVYGNTTNWFGTRKGVRQGYPFSPLLFAMVIADVEEVMKEEQIGGVWIGKNKIWTLPYADDLVLLAKNEESMKETMKSLERYLRNKNLQLNAEKSKMLCFRKGGGRRRRTKWRWKEKSIEEVTEFKYLHNITYYVIRKNGGDDGQIREL